MITVTAGISYIFNTGMYQIAITYLHYQSGVRVSMRYGRHYVWEWPATGAAGAQNQVAHIRRLDWSHLNGNSCTNTHIILEVLVLPYSQGYITYK